MIHGVPRSLARFSMATSAVDDIGRKPTASKCREDFVRRVPRVSGPLETETGEVFRLLSSQTAGLEAMRPVMRPVNQ